MSCSAASPGLLITMFHRCSSRESSQRPVRSTSRTIASPGVRSATSARERAECSAPRRPAGPGSIRRLPRKDLGVVGRPGDAFDAGVFLGEREHMALPVHDLHRSAIVPRVVMLDEGDALAVMRDARVAEVPETSYSGVPVGYSRRSRPAPRACTTASVEPSGDQSASRMSSSQGRGSGAGRQPRQRAAKETMLDEAGIRQHSQLARGRHGQQVRAGLAETLGRRAVRMEHEQLGCHAHVARRCMRWSRRAGIARCRWSRGPRS